MSDRTYLWYSFAMSRPGELPDSALTYILRGLVPYSRPNMKMLFKPALFFQDIETISNRKPKSIKKAYYAAEKAGLIEFDDDQIPQLTAKGIRTVTPYRAKKLGNNARLVVIFDIPEAERWKRRNLRALLLALSFEQVQKSVWASSNDHREYLKEAITDLKLDDCVIVYEALELAI